MSRVPDESNQPSKPQQELFRKLLTDAKFMYLSHVIDQYEVAQMHLRKNEEQHHQVRQYMEYNRLRLLELDLATQRINLKNSMTKDLHSKSGQESSTFRDIVPLSKPPNPFHTLPEATKPQMASHIPHSVQQRSHSVNSTSSHDLKPHAATEILLSLQRELKPNTITETLFPLQRQASTTVSPGSVSVQQPVQQQQPEQGQQEPQQLNPDTCEGDNPEPVLENKLVSPNDPAYLRNWPEKGFNQNDVLCERGNFSYNHPGNKKYRAFVKSWQDRYTTSKKNDKVLITSRVLDYVKRECGGRFMGHDEEGPLGSWRELSDEEARRKIGQSLREKNKRYIAPTSRKRFLSTDEEQKPVIGLPAPEAEMGT
jgi:hypothetical protein